MFVSVFFFILFVVIWCLWNYCINVFNELLNLDFVSLANWNWWINCELDSITLFVWLMLIICFIYVCGYTGHYFGKDSVGSINLSEMINIFVGVMLFLVCTSEFLSTLIFWEFLGVVSFFLILFYGSYLSLRSSIITLVSSRYGDVCLFLLIGCSYFIFGSSLISSIIFFFVIFTKSAGFPFISWLLEAMRAPTPVSSLVHSSTLVAAGVWFSMRYNLLEYLNNIFFFNVFLILTVFITGVCCFYFVDLKKIVALSTCNNISWCVLYLIYGDVCLAIFQLVAHGVAKCVLFMLVGDVMSGSGGSQAANCIYSPYFYGNWGIFSIFSVVLGLSGVPFVGVFFTKHIMLSSFNGVWNPFLFITIMGCVFLSYFYSFRLCSLVININASNSFGVLFFFNSWMIGYLWLFIGFFFEHSLPEHYTLSIYSNLVLLIFQFISCIIAYFLYYDNNFSYWNSTLFGCDNVVESFYSLMNNLVNNLNLFIHRWDNYTIFLFNNIVVKAVVSIYANNILNLLIYSTIIFVVWFVILY
uniref:NADH:ubiquinone reductase (H(+)-translocating) n=1 Tax=Raillietina tetragona TaxID=984823 RepID=A0A0U1Z8F4_9CEST|nr:NADH dehydrogenase subunit 5 [Raillietina tetragona]